jgi:hypothetical protein
MRAGLRAVERGDNAARGAGSFPQPSSILANGAHGEV